ncbi:MAG: DUF2961 domain-containing protein [Chitinophagaceae bacterium]
MLRFYWDDEAASSVEIPVGDFFGMAWGVYALLKLRTRNRSLSDIP